MADVFTVDLELNLAGALKDLDTFSAKASAKLNQATGGSNALKSSLGGVSGVLTKIGAFAGGAKILGFFRDGVSGASDLNEALNKTNVILGDSAQTAIDFSQNANKAIGATQAESLEMVSSLGNLLVNMGQTQEGATDLGIRFTKLAADMGSINNVGTVEVLNAIKSALVGESEPIRRFGIDVRETALKAKALELGLKLVNGKLTDQQRILVLSNLIFDKTKNLQGDFANTSNQMANALKIARSRMSDVVSTVSASFIPLIERALNLFNRLPRDIQVAVTTVGLLTGAVIALNTVVKTNPIVKTISIILAALAALRVAWDQNLFGVQKFFSKAVILFKGFFEIGKVIFSSLTELAKSNFRIMTEVVSSIFAFINTKFLQPFIRVISSVIETTIEIFKKGFNFIKENVITPFVEGIEKVFNFIGKVVGKTFDFIKEEVEESESVFGKTFNFIGNTVGAGIDKVKQFGQGIREAGSNVIDHFTKPFLDDGPKINAIWDNTITMMSQVKDKSEEIVEATQEANDKIVESNAAKNQTLIDQALDTSDTILEILNEQVGSQLSVIGNLASQEEAFRNRKKQKELEVVRQRFANEKKSLARQLQLGLISEAQHNRRLSIIENREKAQTQKLQEEMAKRGLIEKTSLIGSGLANTFEAAIRAFKAMAGIPIVGPALGAAAAAAATAFGLRNVGQIRAQAFADGGLIEGPTLALLGEGIQKELVTPKDDFVSVVNNLLRTKEIDLAGGTRADAGLVRRLDVQERQTDVLLNEMVGLREDLKNLELQADVSIDAETLALKFKEGNQQLRRRLF